MKNWNVLYGFLSVLFVTVIIGCSYDDNVNPELDGLQWEEELGLEDASVDVVIDDLDVESFYESSATRSVKCFSPIFPLSIEYPDGSFAQYENKEEVRIGLIQYYQENGRGVRKAKIVLPFEVVNVDGDLEVVESYEELKALVKECVRERIQSRKKNCLSLVFPVSVNFPNGKQIETKNAIELLRLIHLWKVSNRGAIIRPKLDLPFEVTNDHGDSFQIANRQDLKAAIESCK